MPILTDRQRIELAIPPYLFFALTGAPNVFVPATEELAAKAEQQIAELRDDLQIACFEPFEDLTPMKRRALLRRLERIKGQITAGWGDHPALDLMLMLWCFLRDLTDTGVLILWEGWVMDRAMQMLISLCKHGFTKPKDAAAAEERASNSVLALRAEGLYR